MERYHFIKKSYSYEGKLSFGEKITIQAAKKKNHNLSIYDEYIQKHLLKRQVKKKYQKLLQMLLFYLNTEDDTGVSYQEALNKIEYFRQLIRNKYKAYLNEKQLEEMAKTLTYLKKQAQQKLLFVETKTSEKYSQELESRRRR